jgi:alkylation response protein AidB-like acyl-CoA dehydrogenase
MTQATVDFGVGQAVTPPPAPALDATQVASLAASRGVIDGRDLRELVDVGRALGRAAAANLLVPHYLLPAVLVGAAAAEGLTTVALGEGDEDFELDGVATTLRPTEDGHAAFGVKPLVPSGCVAVHVVVAARLDGELVLAQLALDGDGVERRPVRTVGRNPDADVVFDTAQVESLDVVGREEVHARVGRGLLVASIAQAAEAIGLIDRALELAIEHGIAREAFGRPIGSFQAYQHACADAALERELAVALLDRAAATADRVDASAARAFAADAALRAVRTAVQLHGGKGFLDDHEAARLYRQAKEGELRWGSAAWHLRTITRELVSG